MYKLQADLVDLSNQSIKEFQKNNQVELVIDSYQEQIEELLLIRNPSLRLVPDRSKEIAQFTEEFLEGKSLEESGSWFYFPWNKTLIHYLPDEIFQEVRTARNKNLITKEEQTKFYNTTVGIAGLSVGSHAALTITMSGGSKNIKLADPDTISPSNLNRVRYGASAIGQNKAVIAGRIIIEMNPYANVYIYDQGITPENKDEFLLGSEDTPKIDVIIEEMDNLAMKVAMRFEAKKLKIPLIMATDNGDGVIVDVERYDLNPDMAIFNGALGNVTMEDFQKFQPSDMPKLATKVAGPEFVEPRMLSSLIEVGKTLYSWPQLGTAATICGAAISFVVRAIATGRNITSKKFNLSLEEAFETMNEEEKKQWEAERKQYLDGLGL